MDTAQAIIVSAIMQEAGRLAKNGAGNPALPSRIQNGHIQWAIEDYLRVLAEIKKTGGLLGQ